jgi:hypothetical protein
MRIINFFKKLKKEALDFLNRNKILLFLFFIATIVLFYQHNKNISWDFSAYVLNAKYLFYNGTYFETLRPPLAPLILSLFLIFNILGEYLYIFFVSILFLYANVSLSDSCFSEWIKNDKIKFKKETIRLIFYFFSLGIFTLQYSISSGTELLGLAFFELFLAAILNKQISGYYLGFAFLSRYSFLMFIPLMFLNDKVKKIFLNFLTFSLVVLPWLIFNYIKFGNPLVSIIDAYVNNILFRGYLYQKFNFIQLFSVASWFLPFILSGFIIAAFSISIKRENWFKENKSIFLFLSLIILIILDYRNIPLKEIRYLFNLTLPFAFFSTFGVLFVLSNSKTFVKKENLLKIIVGILFLLNCFIIFIAINSSGNYSTQFYSAASKIKELGIGNCEVLSPHWVLITYLTENVYPLGRNNISVSLNQNKIVLIFKKEITRDDLFTIEELKDYRKLYENEDYFLLIGEEFTIENCAKKYTYDSPYIQNHCEIIQQTFKGSNLGIFLKNVCNLFEKDKIN